MVGKRHADILRVDKGYKEVIDQNVKLRSADYFIEDTYENENKQSYPCYLITKQGCDMVANNMTGAKWVLFTAEYVTKFEDMETQLKTPVVSLPKTYAEALRELAASEEEKEIL